MIPKKIHYCWLGSNEMPGLAIKCIDSWKRFCPDFEIIRWDEDNYDFTKNNYMKQSYLAKKWGFVPDYARLDIIYQYGGIYLDTDVEIVQPLTPLLDNHFFAGLQSSGEINFGQGFGAEQYHPLLKELMDDYNNYSFYNEKGQINLTPSPVIQTKYLSEKYNMILGCKTIQDLRNNVRIYPQEYFDPIYLSEREIKPKLHISCNTYSIHHYMASWVPWYHLFFSRLHMISNYLFGSRITQQLVRLRHFLFRIDHP